MGRPWRWGQDRCRDLWKRPISVQRENVHTAIGAYRFYRSRGTFRPIGSARGSPLSMHATMHVGERGNEDGYGKGSQREG
jgi:hypothetical protein